MDSYLVDFYLLFIHLSLNSSRSSISQNTLSGLQLAQSTAPNRNRHLLPTLVFLNNSAKPEFFLARITKQSTTVVGNPFTLFIRRLSTSVHSVVKHATLKTPLNSHFVAGDMNFKAMHSSTSSNFCRSLTVTM